MSTVPLSTTVRQAKDGVAIVEILGEVTGFAEAILTDAYNQACAGSPRVVVFNFGGAGNGWPPTRPRHWYQPRRDRRQQSLHQPAGEAGAFGPHWTLRRPPFVAFRD